MRTNVCNSIQIRLAYISDKRIVWNQEGHNKKKKKKLIQTLLFDLNLEMISSLIKNRTKKIINYTCKVAITPRVASQHEYTVQPIWFFFFSAHENCVVRTVVYWTFRTLCTISVHHNTCTRFSRVSSLCLRRVYPFHITLRVFDLVYLFTYAKPAR